MKKGEQIFSVSDSLRMAFLFTFIPFLVIIFLSYQSYASIVDNIDRVIVIVLSLILVNIITLKKITLFDSRIEISYLLIPFIWKSVFQLNFIDKIVVSTIKAAPGGNLLYFYLKNGKKKRFRFMGRKKHQELINNIRDIGVDIEVNSSHWE